MRWVRKPKVYFPYVCASYICHVGEHKQFIDSTSSKWLQRNNIEETMLHIFSLFVLPFLLSTASPLPTTTPPMTKTVEAKKGGDFFLYLCIGNGCEGWRSILDTMRGWHIALTVISILVSFFILCCCCCFCCMDDKDEKEDKKQPQVASSSLDQATNK